MSDEQNIREMSAALNPRAQGVVAGLRQVLDQIEKDLAALKEKTAAQEGVKVGAYAVSSAIQQMVVPLKKAVEAETMSVEEAKLRREVILACKDVAMKVAEQSDREALTLKGEGRSLARQLENVRKMWQGTLDGERRKADMGAELEADRGLRGAGRGVPSETPAAAPAPSSAASKGKGRARGKGKGARAVETVHADLEGTKASG